ncbi:MAG: tRNA (adenosine(37)-N6)-dimethylallyltransferase MiaA [Bacteroidales bacterium]|nr:tRNA (adenosine(37)-N6)-dimethylallyltransferase MiaA [Bacteroidales bacterium]
MFDLITVIGPTACGKTSLAVKLAKKIKSEIISADSRQVYRSMDLGTGKDLSEYELEDEKIPYHLIDIKDPGYKYNLFEFQNDFWNAYQQIKSNNKIPILCGGTGMYVESVLKGYNLQKVPENPKLRDSLKGKSLSELEQILKGYKKLHNTTDTDNIKRAIREIEIQEYYKTNDQEQTAFPSLNSLIIGISIDREVRRDRISKRLKARFEDGMLDEVKSLLNNGVNPDDLIYYGLEYKYMTLYLIGEITYQQMYSNLEIAIHQFAKRQMTWFRGMEKRGFSINWIDGMLDDEEKVEIILSLLNN